MIFAGFTTAGVLGVVMFFFLKDAPPLQRGAGAAAAAGGSEDNPSAGLLRDDSINEKSSDDEGEGGGGSGGGKVTVMDTLNLAFTSRRMQLIIPALFFNGMSIAFAQGPFTTIFAQAQDKSGAVTYAGLISAPQYVGYYGATFYFFNSLFSFAWGKLIPLLGAGRKTVLTATALAMGLWLAGMIVVCLGGLASGWPWDAYTHPNSATDTPLAYAVVFSSAIVFALADSVLEGQLPAILQSPTFFPNERERNAANSNLKLWQSLGFAVQFVIGVGFEQYGVARSAQWQAFILVPLYLASYGALLYCDAAVAPFDVVKHASQ